MGAPPPLRSVRIDADLPARVTGIAIDAATTVGSLRAVGCEVRERDGRVEATVPPWRPDLTDPFDLVEEVARLVGYDQVPSVLPPAPPGRGLTAEQRLRRRVGRALAGAGFSEVITFPFVGQAAYDALGLPDDDARRDSLRLATPLSAEAPAMTTTLLPGLLDAAVRNVGRGQGDLALFEVSPVTLPRARKAAPILPVDRRPTEGEWEELVAALPDQPLHLGLVICGEADPSGWWGEGRRASWADAVDAVREVAEALRSPLVVRRGDAAPWHPGRCAELVVGERVVGHAGELHPTVCRRLGLPERSAAAEINLEVVLAHAGPVLAPQFSTFPVAKVDVALVVDAAVAAADVASTLVEGAGPLLESARLFDVFEGEQVGAGRKSLAFALRLRAPDRTLTDEEVAAARDAAVALAGERHGAVLR